MFDPQKAFSIEDLRRAARRRLPRAIFDFYDGGAEDEEALRENCAAFRRTRLLPRGLVDVSTVRPQADVLGAAAAMPLAIAPTGGVGYGWRQGEIAVARAAVAAGVPYTLSTSATVSIEDVATQAPGRLWFQAYILNDATALAALIDRARVAEYEALMITIDLPVGGKRERDARNQLSMPFRFTSRNLAGFATRPRWALQMLRHGAPTMPNLKGLARSNDNNRLASSVGRSYDPGFDWTRLQALRETWPRKLIVKGVLHPDDATRLARMGCDAIVVSNHGGRQLDSASATLDALPAVARAAGPNMEVWVDGGVRRGGDIFKARAAGAHAVLIGRATLWGALAAGEAGATRALEILKDEYTRTMQLCGVCDSAAIDESCLAATYR